MKFLYFFPGNSARNRQNSFAAGVRVTLFFLRLKPQMAVTLKRLKNIYLSYKQRQPRADMVMPWSPGSFSLFVPSSSTPGFYLVAQDNCSSSRPWVSVPVIVVEESVHFCSLKHSLLSFPSCWPGLRHEFIVRRTRKCNFFFFFPEQPCALLTLVISLLKNGRMDLVTIRISSTSLLLGLWEKLRPSRFGSQD